MPVTSAPSTPNPYSINSRACFFMSGGGSATIGMMSYFHWTGAMRSRRASNSSGDRELQNRAMRLAISRRAAAIASAFLFSSIDAGVSELKYLERCKNLSRADGWAHFRLFTAQNGFGVSTERSPSDPRARTGRPSSSSDASGGRRDIRLDPSPRRGTQRRSPGPSRNQCRSTSLWSGT
jgi:hypothetical protein